MPRASKTRNQTRNEVEYVIAPADVELPAAEKLEGLLQRHGRYDSIVGNYKRSTVFGWPSAKTPPFHLDEARRYPVYSETKSYCAILFFSGMAASTSGSLVMSCRQMPPTGVSAPW